MTEEEAKTKWCPHARIGSSRTGLGSLNREIQDGTIPEARCLGSECMAWRRLSSTYTDPRTHRPNNEGQGYCGLAGAPQ